MNRLLYPNPPHLTVVVYPQISEADCFAGVCHAVERMGCSWANVAEVVPWDKSFESRTDLVNEAMVLELDDRAFRTVIAGRTASGRPVTAGFRHSRHGTVLVEYLAAPRADKHPIGVSVASEALGLPVELWRSTHRRQAETLARWSEQLLKDMTEECDALYGGIAVESTPPTPTEMGRADYPMPAEAFLSRRLVEDASVIGQWLSVPMNDVRIEEWPTGWFISAWAPFGGGMRYLPPEGLFTPRSMRKMAEMVS